MVCCVRRALLHSLLHVFIYGLLVLFGDFMHEDFILAYFVVKKGE